MKYLLLFLSMMLTSCVRLQFTGTGNIVSVTVDKTQVTTGEAVMSGSSLEKIAEGMVNKAGDADIKAK